MEYRSAIVDELGYVIAWCDTLSENKINDYLERHPECYIRCVEVYNE